MFFDNSVPVDRARENWARWLGPLVRFGQIWPHPTQEIALRRLPVVTAFRSKQAVQAAER